MSREEYVRKLLEAYRTTPGTTGSIRRPDRVLAAQLHQRGVPLLAVENALVLAVAPNQRLRLSAADMRLHLKLAQKPRPTLFPAHRMTP